MQTLASPSTAQLPATCPAWCDGSCHAYASPELFHARDVAEVEMRDADLLDDPTTAWVAIESLDDRAAQIRLNIRPSRARRHDTGLQLTPDQAIELGRALLMAGIVGGRA